MTSKTNEKALEATIEKSLTGICLEELKEQNISARAINEKGDYRLRNNIGNNIGNGYYIGLPEDFNAQFAIDEQRFWNFLQNIGLTHFILEK